MIKTFNMTPEMLEDCILNSKLFRDAVIAKLLEPDLGVIHSQIMKVMRETNGHMNKIAFIKGIREASENHTLEFAQSFPGIVNRDDYMHPVPTRLGLTDSKNIAESYIALHSPPCTP